MADPLTIVGITASIASLIDLGSKVVARLHEFNSSDGHSPVVLQDISSQLPLLLEIVYKIQNHASLGTLGQDAEVSLASTINGCIRQIAKIDNLVKKWSPSEGDSSFKRVRKAIASVTGDKKVMEILRVLEMYKTTLHMYATSSNAAPSFGYDLQDFNGLPSRQVPYFVGRTDILQRIAHHLEAESEIVKDRKIVVLTGMGGQGKSQIALEYARRAQASRTFDFVVWVDASSADSLVRGFGSIAESLTKNRFIFPDDKARVTYVKQFFEQLSGKWMFVLDNYDRPDLFHCVRDYLPSGDSGAFLFTSRHVESQRLGTHIAITHMDENEAVELLLHRAKREASQENLAQAKVIASKLGCLALALDQAGSYLSSRRLPLKDFLEHYEGRKEAILKYTPALWEYRKKLSQGEEESSISAFTTWEMSLEQTGDGDELKAISHFLTLSAFLDSSDVREALFCNYLLSQPQLLQWMSCLTTEGKWDVFKFQDLIASLQALSLLECADFRSVQTRYSLHPLIRDWLRLRVPKGGCPNFAREAIRLVTASLDAASKEVTGLEMRRIIISHIDACVANDKEIFGGRSDLGLVSMENAASLFASTYNFHGRYEDARSLFASLLRYQTKHSSPHSLQTVMNLANALRNQSQYDEAERLYMNVLTEREREFGPKHVDTLRAIEGLATIHGLQEKFKEADREYQQLLETREGDCGRSSAETLRAVEGLANVRRHQRRYNEAEALYGRVLQVHIPRLGPRSPDTLRCCEGLAITYRHQGRLEESIRLYVQVLEDRERILGTCHPLSLCTALNLSIAYVYQEDDVKAESFALRAHKGFESLLGPEHASTRRAAEQLAETRILRTKKFNHTLFHHGLQRASMYELEELRDDSKSVSITDPNDSHSLNSSRFTDLRALDQGECGTCEADFRQLILSVRPSTAMPSDIETSCLTRLSDDQGRNKLKSAATGRAFHPGRFRGRMYIVNGVFGSPFQTFASVGADLARVTKLLQENYGIGPDVKDKAGQTPISKAAKYGFADYVGFLLERGDVVADSRCKLGCTPLMYAAQGGHEQTVRLLLERKDVDRNAQDSYGRTPLIFAAWHNQTEIVKVLLSSKTVEVNSKDHNGETSLLWAVDQRNAELVKLLLDSGAQQIQSNDYYARTPLARACYRGCEDILEALLEAEPPNSQSVNYAFTEGHGFADAKIARRLLETGMVEVNGTDKFGRTPLHSAAARGNHETCALLLDLGADPSIRNKDGETPLLPAASYGKSDVVKVLLEHAAVDAGAADSQGRTPLSYAMEHGHEDVLKHLLAASVRVDMAELEALPREKWVTAERREAMLRLARDAKSGSV